MGRPAGSGNREYRRQTVEPSRCPVCESTDRDPYFAVLVRSSSGRTADGRPWTRAVERRTRCRSCGQYRLDLFYEHPGGGAGYS